MPDYTKEQLWKVYEKLPEDLKEAIFSAETADNIYDICTRNGIEDDKISEIAKLTGRVLMGILPPEDFQETLEKELKLKKDIAKKIAHEINRFIFFPVKESLAALYIMEVVPPVKPSVGPSPIRPAEIVLSEVPSEEIPSEVAPPKEEQPKRVDVYREPVE